MLRSSPFHRYSGKLLKTVMALSIQQIFTEYLLCAAEHLQSNMLVNKIVATTGRVVLCKFCINSVSNFSSSSAQEMVIPTAASEPFPTQIISSSVAQVMALLMFIINTWLYNSLLAYNKKFEQECA